MEHPGQNGISISNFIGHDCALNAVDTDGFSAGIRIFSVAGYPSLVHSNVTISNVTLFNLPGNSVVGRQPSDRAMAFC